MQYTYLQDTLRGTDFVFVHLRLLRMCNCQKGNKIHCCIKIKVSFITNKNCKQVAKTSKTLKHHRMHIAQIICNGLIQVDVEDSRYMELTHFTDLICFLSKLKYPSRKSSFYDIIISITRFKCFLHLY